MNPVAPAGVSKALTRPAPRQPVAAHSPEDWLMPLAPLQESALLRLVTASCGKLCRGLGVEREPMRIRIEEQRDWPAVRAVNESAFETSAEADLVAALRTQAVPVVSLVAEDEGSVVGHIMFSPVTLSGHPDLKIMGLAPMAVDRRHQHKGIGSLLVRAGLDECKRLGYGAAVVLGHPGYYPRFGFVTASSYGITCVYEVPDEAFMVVELLPGYLGGASGKIHYHDAFLNV